jgi:hypothetical protein
MYKVKIYQDQAQGTRLKMAVLFSTLALSNSVHVLSHSETQRAWWCEWTKYEVGSALCWSPVTSRSLRGPKVGQSGLSAPEKKAPGCWSATCCLMVQTELHLQAELVGSILNEKDMSNGWFS